jgi:hypothetical protein
MPRWFPSPCNVKGCTNPKVSGRGKRFCVDHPPEFPSDKSYWRDPERYKRRVRNHELMKKYGLTRSQYERLKKLPCQICGCKRKIMHIDHKIVGTMRGWLCHRCNPALGLFDHNPALLRAAAEYLEGGDARVV